MDAFPSRKEVIQNIKKDKLAAYQENLVNDIKSVEVEKINFDGSDFKPRIKVTEKQKVFIWIRLFLKDDNLNVNPDDTIKITHINSGEFLDTKFICFSKKGIDKNSENEIINYDTEDDKKVLCLMVDSDRINSQSDDIPFIRTLFKTSRHYEYQLLKRGDLEFRNLRTNEVFDYFDVNF